jgi:hypothetical protein
LRHWRERLQYFLGPKFFKDPLLETNSKEKYRLDVSAYGPMFCMAKVYIKNRQEPILLDRYIDFEVP